MKKFLVLLFVILCGNSYALTLTYTAANGEVVELKMYEPKNKSLKRSISSVSEQTVTLKKLLLLSDGNNERSTRFALSDTGIYRFRCGHVTPVSGLNKMFRISTSDATNYNQFQNEEIFHLNYSSLKTVFEYVAESPLECNKLVENFYDITAGGKTIKFK